jgi:hypothetical protein
LLLIHARATAEPKNMKASTAADIARTRGHQQALYLLTDGKVRLPNALFGRAVTVRDRRVSPAAFCRRAPAVGRRSRAR